MTLPVQTPLNRYTYTGSSTFAYTFLLLDAGDLRVSVDGVAKTLNSDYTVAGVGTVAGGVVTYLGTLTNGQVVALLRDITLQRATDYQEEGDFLSAEVNTDFDRLWMALQDEDTILNAQALRAPAGEALNDLPAQAVRAAGGTGSLLGFDSTGQPVLAGPLNGSPTALALMLANPNGAALVGFIQPQTGAVSETLQEKNRRIVDIEDFGGVADGTFAGSGTDNSNAFDLAVAALGAFGGVVNFGVGKYYIATSRVIGNIISGGSHVVLRGKGRSESDNDTAATELILGGSITFNAKKCGVEHMVIRGKTGHSGDLVQVSGNGFFGLEAGFFSAGQDCFRVGTDADDGQNADAGQLVSCIFNAGGRFGMYFHDAGAVSNAHGWTITHCIAQSNGNDGARFGIAHLHTIVGGLFEANGGAGVRFTTGARGNVIIGGDYEANGAGNIIVDGTDNDSNSIHVATLYYESIINNNSTTMILAPSSSAQGFVHAGVFRHFLSGATGNDFACAVAGGYGRLTANGDPTTDANSHLTWKSDGLHVGQPSGAVGFYNATPISKPTTAGAAAGFTANSGTAVNDASTFDGYTLKQVVKALRNYGLLA